VLDEDTFRNLERVAAAEHRPIDDVVRDAVRSYLAQRTVTDDEWRARFEALVERIQSRIPPDVTPEQIEADVAAAVAEVRQARRARRD
jgi:hypothetical protein